MNVKFWGQNEIKEGHQAIFWYIFLIDGIPDNLESFLIEFIHSDNFKTSCLPFIEKKARDKNDRFLQSAFNTDALSITDFRILRKEELLLFFDDYSKDDTWGDDSVDFVIVMNKFNHLVQQESNERYFLVSKEWFDKENKILNEDSEIYIYYFLIIWLDADKKMINVCQWNYD